MFLNLLDVNNSVHISIIKLENSTLCNSILLKSLYLNIGLWFYFSALCVCVCLCV